jgi:hypothetical protein
MHWLLYVGLAAVAVLAAYGFLRGRGGKRRRVHTTRCRHCGQKLRYGEDKEGRALPCPRCLRTCTLTRSHVRS